MLAGLAVPTTLMGAHVGILQGEKRWAALSWVYVLAGVPRIVGLGVLWWHPTESIALHGSGLGYIAPVVLGWWVLRRPRATVPRGGRSGTLGVVAGARGAHSSQALLAFFALANVDIVVARHVLDDHDSGSTRVGLLVAKIMLYLPQFVVIVMFPSLATASERRRAVLRGTSAILALGPSAPSACCCSAASAADLLDSEKLRAVEGHLWLFAVLGTMLSVTQLLVYATLAREVAVDPAGLGRAGRRRPRGAATTTPTGCFAVMNLRDGGADRVLVVTSLRAPTAPRARRAQCAASCQLRPTPTDTSSGTARSRAAHLGAHQRGQCLCLAGATSKTSSSWTWSSIRERRPCSCSARSTFSIATLTRSAAEPWIGALSAIRSASRAAAGCRWSGRG